MSNLQHHWKQMMGWIIVGSFYGLLWGAAVAMLLTLSPELGRTEAWPANRLIHMILAERMRIGALSGSFFGALAALIAVVDRLQLELEREPGQHMALLLGGYIACFIGQIFLCQQIAHSFIALADWQHIVTDYHVLLSLALYTVPFLAFPPLLLVNRQLTREVPV